MDPQNPWEQVRFRPIKFRKIRTKKEKGKKPPSTQLRPHSNVTYLSFASGDPGCRWELNPSFKDYETVLTLPPPAVFGRVSRLPRSAINLPFLPFQPWLSGLALKVSLFFFQRQPCAFQP